MPRKARSDKDVRDTSVIRGLRMERDLAQAVREHARTQRLFRTRDGKGNVAACVRHLLRLALRVATATESQEREGEFSRIGAEKAVTMTGGDGWPT